MQKDYIVIVTQSMGCYLPTTVHVLLPSTWTWVCGLVPSCCGSCYGRGRQDDASRRGSKQERPWSKIRRRWKIRKRRINKKEEEGNRPEASIAAPVALMPALSQIDPSCFSYVLNKFLGLALGISDVLLISYLAISLPPGFSLILRQLCNALGCEKRTSSETSRMNERVPS